MDILKLLKLMRWSDLVAGSNGEVHGIDGEFSEGISGASAFEIK